MSKKEIDKTLEHLRWILSNPEKARAVRTTKGGLGSPTIGGNTAKYVIDSFQAQSRTGRIKSSEPVGGMTFIEEEQPSPSPLSKWYSDHPELDIKKVKPVTYSENLADSGDSTPTEAFNEVDKLLLTKGELIPEKLSIRSVQGYRLRFLQCGMPGLFLERCGLYGFISVRSLMKSACFQETSLDQASFMNCMIRDSKFKRSNFYRSQFIEALFPRAFFERTTMDSAIFQRCSFFRSNFDYCDLRETDLRNCDLRGVKITAAQLEDMNVVGD